jgi:hypothetical protein
MVDWICSVPLSELRKGLQKVEVGRSTDPRSALYGAHFHVLHSTIGSTIHLIGSDGPDRGAIYHVEAIKLGADSSYRCVLPGEFQARIEAEFDPAEVLRLGMRKAGAEFVVAGVVKSRQLVFQVRLGWGTQGLACFADASFTVVEPGVYWVKGGVKPLVQTSQALAQVSATVQVSDIFVENDFDEYDDELDVEEPVEVTAAAPSPVLAAPGPAAPAILRAPGPPRLMQSPPTAPAIWVTAPAAPSLRTQKAPVVQPAKAQTMERATQNEQRTQQN